MIDRIIFCLLIAVIMPVHAIKISDVYHQPMTMILEDEQKVEILYTLSEPTSVELNIYDDRNILIRRLVNSNSQKGENTFVWDGKDEIGRLVPTEAYHYTLMAIDEGKKVVHDLSDITGNDTLSVKPMKWNSVKKQFQYILRKPARVLIRVGLDNHGPLLGTIANWSPRPAGQRIELWDGMDISKVIDLTNHPKLDATIQAYSLSDNTIIVQNKNRKGKYIEDITWPVEYRKKKNPSKIIIAAAYQQAAETRGDYKALITFPEVKNFTKEGLPIIVGKTPIIVDAPDDMRKIALSRRSEPVLFIDGQFALENEVGFLPMTWIIDTTNMHKGEHYLSVNLRGYEGNFGMATVKVYVEK